MSAKTKICAVLAAVLAAGSAAFCASAEGIGLQPVSAELEIAPGARTRQVVTLANMDPARPVSVSLSLADWTLDETGTLLFGPAEETGESAAGWARFSPSTLSLAPGQSKQVMIDLAAPEPLERTGDYRFALLASTVLRDESGAWSKRQVASLFYLTAGKAASRPKITASRLTALDDGTPAIALDFSNPGNAHARLEGEIEIRDGDGTVQQSVPVEALVVLNGARRQYIAPLGQPLPADAVIDVRLDNLFAPQKADETEALPVHRVGREPDIVDIAAPVGGQY